MLNIYNRTEQLIIDALMMRDTVSTQDIMEMGIWQPAAVIFSLREKGVVIEKIMKKILINGRLRTIAHYKLLGGVYE